MVVQGADHVAIKQPLNSVGSPVDAVGVELGLGVGDLDGRVAVVAGSVSLSKVIGLNRSRVSADLLL